MAFPERQSNWRNRIKDSRKTIVPVTFDTTNSFLTLDGQIMVKRDTDTTDNVIYLADRHVPEKRTGTAKNIFRSAAYIGIMTVGLEASAMGVKIGISA